MIRSCLPQQCLGLIYEADIVCLISDNVLFALVTCCTFFKLDIFVFRSKENDEDDCQQHDEDVRHLLFTYGTLKHHEPNHFQFNDLNNGKAQFIANAVTHKKWPLVVTTKWNLPFLIYRQGEGHVSLKTVAFVNLTFLIK